MMKTFMHYARHYYARVVKGSGGRVVGLVGLLAVAVVVIVLSAAAYSGTLRGMMEGIVATFLILSVPTVLFFLGRIRARINDVQFSVSLEHSLNRAQLEVPELFYDGAAGTPSLQLYILKTLLMCKPANVLELGSGQTTRLLSAFSKKHESTHVVTIEQDEAWASVLRPTVEHGRHIYLRRGLVQKRFSLRSGATFETAWYDDLPQSVSAGRFDLLIVDGPDDYLAGTQFSENARSGVIWHLPEILADEFVVIFDDADLYKHQMAIDLFKKALRSLGVKFTAFKVHGIKDQEVICTRRYSFLRSV